MQYTTNSFRCLRFTIGQNIHKARCHKKMTLRKLSELSGISVNLLDFYEIGKFEIRLNELYRISCALDMDLGKLVPASLQ